LGGEQSPLLPPCSASPELHLKVLLRKTADFLVLGQGKLMPAGRNLGLTIPMDGYT